MSALAALILAAAALLLGRPEWQRAGRFLTGVEAGPPGAIATAVALYWVVAGLTVAVAGFLWLRRVRLPRAVRTSEARAAMSLGVGVAILVAGVLHQLSAGYPMCCGGGARQEQEARRLAQ